MAGTITASEIIHRPRGNSKVRVDFTVDASGDATITKVGPCYGRLVGVVYNAGDMDTGADITVTDSDSGATVFSLTNAGTSDRFVRPTAVITDNAGAAVTADATAPNVNRDVYLSGVLKVVVAQGGNAKSGALTFVLDEGPEPVA